MSAPARQGQPWTDEEIQQLLQGVKRKESVEQIALMHERTRGGIQAKLQQLAADYYFNNNLPLKDIMKFTGLDDEIITDAISKRQWQMDQREKKSKEGARQQTIPQMMQQQEVKKEGMVSLLSEIRDMMKEMLDILKKDTAPKDTIHSLSII